MRTPSPVVTSMLRWIALCLLLVPAVAAAQGAAGTSIEVPRDQLDRLAGSYELTPMATMLITVAGTELQAQAGSQPPMPLLAQSATVFRPSGIDAELTFELPASGKATALTLRQNGQVLRAPRIAERTEVALSPAVLARYPGTYQLQPGFDVVITLENGQLMLQATGQGKAALFAESESKFFMKLANAQIEFVTADGRVTELVLFQGGQQMRAPRK